MTSIAVVLVFLLLTLNILLTISIVSVVDFEQVNVSLVVKSYSVTAQSVLFDFGLKKLFNKMFAFPPLYRNFYIFTYLK